MKFAFMKIFQLTFIELSDLLTLNLCILMNVERMTVFWSLKCLSFTWSCWEMEKKILSFVPFNFLSFITKPVMKINYTSASIFFPNNSYSWDWKYHITFFKTQFDFQSRQTWIYKNKFCEVVFTKCFLFSKLVIYVRTGILFN